MGKKLADFTASKLGGIVYYGAVLTLPMALAGGLHNAVSPDFNDNSTPESTAAAAEYLQENRDLYDLHDEYTDKIRALEKASSKQDTPDDVLAFQDRKNALESELSDRLEDFAIRVLTDTRLNEADYNRIEDEAQLDTSPYAKLNLPNIPNILDETRADFLTDDKKTSAYQIRDAMMNSTPYAFWLPKLTFLLMLGALGGSVVTSLNGTAKKKREDLTKRLSKMGRPKQSH